MTTPSSAHISEEDLERFSRKTLPAATVVPLTDHLAGCVDCRQRLSRSINMEAALASIGHVWDGSSTHVPESDVHAFVDGRIEDARRDEIARHLEVCGACRNEIRDLQASVAAPKTAARVSRVWRYGGLAAAATLLLALAVPTLLRRDGAASVTVLYDAGGPVRIDAEGNAQVAGLSAEDGDHLRRTLSSGRLSFPSYATDLIGARAVVRGDIPAVAFALVSPVATAVPDTRPRLRWTPASTSATYVVTMQEESTGATVSSPALRTPAWIPSAPLTRGRTYLWQVAASFDGREAVAPVPPDPPAKLFVLTEADALRVAQAPPSHLVRGILYAQVGLFDEAERELGALATQNPGSSLAEGLVRQVKELRRR